MFNRKRCQRLIEYQNRTIKFKADVGEGIFSLGDFETKMNNIVVAGEVAKALDDYQYLICDQYKHLRQNDPEFKSHLEDREKVIKILTAFRMTLEAFKMDPTGQRKNLENIVTTMQGFFIITDLIKKTPTKKEIKEIDEDIEELSDKIEKVNPKLQSDLISVSKTQKKITLSLLIVIFMITIISAQILLGGFENSDSTLKEVKTKLETKVLEIWTIQHKTKLQLEGQLYDSEISMPTSIHNLINAQNSQTISEILTTMYASNPDIKYGFIAAPANEKCEILFYKPYDKIYDSTIDFSKRDWCKELQQRSDYLTINYYSTGPGSFVNTLDMTLNWLTDTQTPSIAYFGVAIDWNRNLQEILREIKQDNIRLVLVDHGGYVVADCSKEKIMCNDFRKNISLQKSVEFNINDYVTSNSLEKHTQLDPVDITSYANNPLNPKILDDWNLYLIYQENGLNYKALPILLFVFSMSSLLLVVYHFVTIVKKEKSY